MSNRRLKLFLGLNFDTKKKVFVGSFSNLSFVEFFYFFFQIFFSLVSISKPEHLEHSSSKLVHLGSLSN